MEKLMIVLGGGLLIAALLFATAVLGGTVVYLCWPLAVPAAFPGAVAAGWVPAALSWQQAVCLTWLFGSLFPRASQAYTNKKAA